MTRQLPEPVVHTVASAMDALADVSQEVGPLPDPSFIWWKAQLLRRFDADARATAPIAVADRLHVGAAILGAVALAAGAWGHVSSSLGAVALTLGALIALPFIGIIVWGELRGR